MFGFASMFLVRLCGLNHAVQPALLLSVVRRLWLFVNYGFMAVVAMLPRFTLGAGHLVMMFPSFFLVLLAPLLAVFFRLSRWQRAIVPAGLLSFFVSLAIMVVVLP